MALGNVVVIGSDLESRLGLATILRTHGYTVTIMDTPLGTRVVLAYQRPCAIVLDMALPYASGVSFLTKIKTDPRSADLPVVVVWGLEYTFPESIQRLANVVLRIPFEPSDLLDLVGAACAGALQGGGLQERARR